MTRGRRRDVLVHTCTRKERTAAVAVLITTLYRNHKCQSVTIHGNGADSRHRHAQERHREDCTHAAGYPCSCAHDSPPRELEGPCFGRVKGERRKEKQNARDEHPKRLVALENEGVNSCVTHSFGLDWHGIRAHEEAAQHGERQRLNTESMQVLFYGGRVTRERPSSVCIVESRCVAGVTRRKQRGLAHRSAS